MRGLLSIFFRLPQYVRLAWRLMWDARVPWYPKLFVILALLYGISPIDIIPEGFFPFFGFGEDIALLFLSIRNLIALSPPDIVKQHAQQIAEKK